MDYSTLLNIKIKYSLYLFLLSSLFLALLLFLLSQSFASSIEVFGISSDSALILTVPIEDSDTINKGSKLKIGENTYGYEIIERSGIEIDPQTYLRYQTFTLKVEKTFQNNEVFMVTIYENEEKIIKKIKRYL